MLRRVQALEVPDENPFANDVLHRYALAKNLTTLCQNADTPYVIAIDGAWGTGKTTFLRMWEKHLQKAGFTTISFNAWEVDYIEEPGVALIGEMQSAVSQKRIDLSKHPNISKIWKQTKSVGAKVLGYAAPVMIKLATKGLVDVHQAGSAIHESAEGLPGVAERIAREQIRRFTSHKRSLARFKELLQRFAEEIPQVEGKSRRPLIFLIDELDRCKPTFSVELLERLKHVFGVTGIIFILAVDRLALAHSIKSVYGSEFDSLEYLRRFFNFRVQLQTPDLSEFCESVFDKINFESQLRDRHLDQGEAELCSKIMVRFSNVFCLSLRTIEQAISEIYALVAMTPKDKTLMLAELAAFVGLRNARSDLFEQFLSNRLSATDLLAQIEKSGAASLFNQHAGQWIRAYFWVWSGLPGELGLEISRLRSIAEEKEQGGAVDQGRIDDAKAMLGRLDYLNARETRDLVNYLKERLRLVYRFD